MNTSNFDYFLPSERIAQAPIEPRDSSRLLVLGRQNGQIEHHHFYEIDRFLRPGDLLIVNESKVFKARLQAVDPDVEVFLLHAEEGNWVALAKPGRKLVVGGLVTFEDGRTCEVVEKRPDGTVVLNFHSPAEEILEWTDTSGTVPIPPYVEQPVSQERYQTVYAKTVGSVAAPTAGFHFTPELIEKLKSQGIRFASVTLHVGLGTFRPMKTDTLEEHEMHQEWLDVPEETTKAIEETKRNGGRVIAVGTTTVRALESGIQHGFTNIFITPGYTFKVIDGLITNFHLPKSTLLVLVSAFAGRESILHAYEVAIKEEYRFYSFGDAMLIL